ncbi:MAG: hypothetical protein KKA54_08710 [Proteobacteria bacterium]|nr:hypothetical protein [Pseudomonadota bacterium]MBU0966449.1 hypothetical protein [Pseudomonadota bacterium]
MKKKGSLDFYLLLSTVAVLFVISTICIYGMFYFKLAQIQQLAPTEKLAYMNRMNSVIAPFIIALILLLGICVPKRLLPAAWLNRFAIVLALIAGGVSLWFGVKTGLVLVLAASLMLQLVVLVLAVGGSQLLHFEKSGYWVRLGSSLIHLGMILFVLDLFFYQHQSLHLILFWITTGAVVLGMIFCFYSQNVVQLVSSIRKG